MPSNLNTPEPIFKLGERHSQTILWRFNKELYRLIGTRCTKCEKYSFPRRWKCAYCGSTELEERHLRRTGKVLFAEFSRYGTSRGYEDSQPQLFATIELDDGPLLDAEIVNVPRQVAKNEILDQKGWEFWDRLKGRRVRLVVRRLRKFDNGNITYGYKAVLEDPPWR